MQTLVQVLKRQHRGYEFTMRTGRLPGKGRINYATLTDRPVHVPAFKQKDEERRANEVKREVLHLPPLPFQRPQSRSPLGVDPNDGEPQRQVRAA